MYYDKFMGYYVFTYINTKIENGVKCVAFKTDNDILAKELFSDVVNYWAEQTDGYLNHDLNFYPKIEKLGKYWFIYSTMVENE